MLSLLVLAAISLMLGFFFAVNLVMFLWPIYKATSPMVSLVFFIAAGVFVPFYIEYIVCSTHFHGDPSMLESDRSGAVVRIIIYSLIGAISAFSGWLFLRKRPTNVRTWPIVDFLISYIFRN